MSLGRAAGIALIGSGQYDDGLTTRYKIPIGTSPNHVQHTGGVVRHGIRFDTGSAGLGNSVKSVWVYYRKYGNPIGNVTVNIRKASDDTVAATIGTFPI